MGRLAITTLGTPEVSHAGEPLRFRTRMTLALLIYLAVEGDRHSREELAAIFWPDSDEAHGRSLLRRTLAFLRQALDEPAPQEASEHLLVERDSLGFNAAADFSLDLQSISAGMRAAR